MFGFGVADPAIPYAIILLTPPAKPRDFKICESA
jgi:hypothetical protein